MDTYSTTFINRCFMNGEKCSKQDKLKVNPKQVFAIMQFSGKNNVRNAIAEAAKESDLVFHRADMKQSNEMLYCKICRDIQNSRFIVADISELNPNVLLEVGLAAAIGRTVQLIKADASKAPTDLLGKETINYDADDVQVLKENLCKWFNTAKSEHYLFDDYLSGHMLRAEKMEIALDYLNAAGDMKTQYDVAVQKIGLSHSTDNQFAMPYHDSDSVDVSEDYFSLRATDETKQVLEVNKIIFTKRLKRFCIMLPDLKFEERRSFAATLKEKQLFNQKGSDDYYDVNVVHPTELFILKINFHPKWKICKNPQLYYGESGSVVKSNVSISNTENSIRCEVKRPKVGLTYILRWNWDK